MSRSLLYGQGSEIKVVSWCSPPSLYPSFPMIPERNNGLSENSTNGVTCPPFPSTFKNEDPTTSVSTYGHSEGQQTEKDPLVKFFSLIPFTFTSTNPLRWDVKRIQIQFMYSHWWQEQLSSITRTSNSGLCRGFTERCPRRWLVSTLFSVLGEWYKSETDRNGYVVYQRKHQQNRKSYRTYHLPLYGQYLVIRNDRLSTMSVCSMRIIRLILS